MVFEEAPRLLWNSKLADTSRQEEGAKSSENIFLNKNIVRKFQYVLMVYHIMGNSFPWNSISRVLNRCSSVRILQIDLSFCTYDHDAMIETLSGLVVTECKVCCVGTFNDRYIFSYMEECYVKYFRHNILEVIRALKAGNLVLSAWDISQQSKHFFKNQPAPVSG